MERAELYFAAHPGSPSAVRRPRLLPRSGTWVAIVGKNFQRNVLGLGRTPESALRAFDVRYLQMLDQKSIGPKKLNIKTKARGNNGDQIKIHQ